MSMIDTFKLFTETDIRQLLKRSSNVFCPTDSMPVKWCQDVLMNPITKIVNK